MKTRKNKKQLNIVRHRQAARGVSRPKTQLHQTVSRQNVLLALIICIGCIGYATYGLGLLGLLKTYQTITMGAGIVIGFIWYIRKKIPKIKQSHHSPPQKALIGLITLQWMVNSLGILVPDTSFDAIWYHLPEAQVYATTGKIARIPELLYSTMPRLGEMYLTLGFLFGGPTLTRLITFGFSILFVLLTYALARRYCTKTTSLLIAAITNSMFVIAWQSTAGYVDIITAVFLLSSLVSLLSSSLLLSAICLGFALSVKMQAIIALPAILTWLLETKKRAASGLWFMLLTLAVATPWYLDNYISTGSPIYPLNQPFKQADQLTYAGTTSIKDWIIHQTIRLPLAPFHLSLVDFQLTPVITLLLPLIFLNRKSVLKSHFPLIGYVAVFLLCWWFLPPPEPRYALAIVPPLLTLLFLHKPSRILIALTLVSIAASLAIRTGITYKHLTTPNYIKSQTTDFNRDKMEKFYSGYWQNYRYK